MRRGVDTNVLVYAHMPAMKEHARARRFLEAALADGDTLVVTPSVLHELIHVVTDPRRFDPPLRMSEAIALARRYLDSSNVECIAVGDGALQLALEILERHRLGRKRIADALFGATLQLHGVTEVITSNPQDFAPFEGLRRIDPLTRR